MAVLAADDQGGLAVEGKDHRAQHVCQIKRILRHPLRHDQQEIHTLLGHQGAHPRPATISLREREACRDVWRDRPMHGWLTSFGSAWRYLRGEQAPQMRDLRRTEWPLLPVELDTQIPREADGKARALDLQPHFGVGEHYRGADRYLASVTGGQLALQKPSHL